ncbi:MAG: glycine--tRNA ligase subunit beta [Gammaproteobacteria bacterium]|jgi:glycyl-tRNA synthetase beta chain|nr:glycine--tRNA ligase subunit beta [Gammaproteobacteria bacterium]MBT5223332.1 glycine--tRNA ligase subunit beta [Gammaproteobacteria bacterium]MBT5825244.1 glycine--tRNA ligase subunit beta [Gammaproteobacteria bacterium]MBT5967180.1 glycine--tRNA ligase subunit beta [Gammaproteobacteria bacterium]MBT6420131.1 glycine--tRNA ligase subunit beta [Gammaproteobacteria bacterium]
MSDTQDLLFELGCEELPPASLRKLSDALLKNIQQGLTHADLSFGESIAYATPRRLAVLIKDLVSSQADKRIEKRGPALQAAFNAEGEPSKASLGFAKSCGTTVEQLSTVKTDKGEWLSFTQKVKGQASVALIPEIISKSISQLPIAKRMRWGSSNIEFVRPVHWAVLLYGQDIINTEILGLSTSNTTYGHRFHAPEAITIDAPLRYESILLEQGKVIADFNQRMQLIRDAANSAASAVDGIAHIEEDLLEEIAALNEFPVPITGTFDTRYLALPDEVLITTMQINQKYFPVKNARGDLLAHFITFSNIESKKPESIQKGNERVVMPRLADAEFFWDQDRKLRLEERVEQLGSIIFQKKLGSLADKSQRVENLAEFIANSIDTDADHVRRAAKLAKTDLVTNMVEEFGSLQGLMGRYYALADGESVEVAQAIEEQYYPKGSGSPTASSATGQILSIAEKIDTLTGIFSAGLIPSGDKDPYALRRSALGALRTMIENKLEIHLIECVDFALTQFTHEFDLGKTRGLVIPFIFERLKGYCLDQGFTADEFEAVVAVLPTEPYDFMRRLQAVQNFRGLAEAESLAAANKRISNILRKSDNKPAESVGKLAEAAEIALLASAEQAEKDVAPLLASKDYQAALNRLAGLRAEVDTFFDDVMVMCDDLDLRANRLALLTKLSRLFLQIADISRLQS